MLGLTKPSAIPKFTENNLALSTVALQDIEPGQEITLSCTICYRLLVLIRGNRMLTVIRHSYRDANGTQEKGFGQLGLQLHMQLVYLVPGASGGLRPAEGAAGGGLLRHAGGNHDVRYLSRSQS